MAKGHAPSIESSSRPCHRPDGRIDLACRIATIADRPGIVIPRRTAMLETVRLLCDYTLWADGRMFEAASKLGADQWTKDMGSSLKSARDTIVHLASAQWIWISRWKGESPKAMWTAIEYPTPASVQARWGPLRSDLASFVEEQTEDSLRKPLSYRNLKGDPFTYPLGHLMLHLTN